MNSVVVFTIFLVNATGENLNKITKDKIKVIRIINIVAHSPKYVFQYIEKSNIAE